MLAAHLRPAAAFRRAGADRIALHVLRETYVQQHPPNAGAAANWLANRQPALWKSLRTATEITADGEAISMPPIIIVRGVGSRSDAEALAVEAARERQLADERRRTIDADPRDDIWPDR